ILLIPAALLYSFGVAVGDRRQGWALLAAVLLLFAPLAAVGGGGGAGEKPAPEGRAGAPPGGEIGREGARLWPPASALLGAGGPHRDLQRLDQQRARLLHAAGGPFAAAADADGRGGVRRRRVGSVWLDPVRAGGGVHRRADGGAHAGIPGEENRAVRDEDGLP